MMHHTTDRSQSSHRDKLGWYSFGTGGAAGPSDEIRRRTADDAPHVSLSAIETLIASQTKADRPALIIVNTCHSSANGAPYEHDGTPPRPIETIYHPSRRIERKHARDNRTLSHCAPLLLFVDLACGDPRAGDDHEGTHGTTHAPSADTTSIDESSGDALSEASGDASGSSGDPAVCGDELCAPGEVCPADCPVDTCGDGSCSPAENDGSCPEDCGTCGDSVVEGLEECDAGPDNAENGACRPGCVEGVCGDAHVLEGAEDCDDGNRVDDDACPNDCDCVCGDGFVCSPLEECDLGAANAEDAACNSSCQRNVCGDGEVLIGVEACDNGPDNADDAACTLSCQTNVCGDGHVLSGVEACDDGPDNADDAPCLPSCHHNVCGDGHGLPGVEECDDGADNGVGMPCNGSCIRNVCGDGDRLLPDQEQPGEECDDKNTIDTDGCSNDCDEPRLVFLTSKGYGGGGFGGLDGADERCEELAAAGVDVVRNRYYRAWLSVADDSASPWARIRDPEFSGWYKLVDGSLVARGWAGLVGGDTPLEHAITIDQHGGEVPAATSVWTNTDINGKAATTFLNCEGWTTSDPDFDGYVGVAKPDLVTSQWTLAFPATCGSGKSLYCFEVKP